MPKTKERVSMAVSLPIGLVKEIDHLVDEKVFGSRSEALRYGARLAVLFRQRIHTRAADYAYEESIQRFQRDRHVS